MSSDNFSVFAWSDPKTKILHYSWLAFFITFFMWFCHASLMPYIKETFDLTTAEAKALLFLNVALTIPARIFTGALVDKYGPRLMFSLLLAISGVFCLFFAAAQTYEQLAAARFLLGFTGAGFVIGIRMVSEWFPANELGTAEGIYGGWGNFGSAASAMSLPVIALFVTDTFGIEEGWRYAIALTGLMSLAFSFIWYFNVTDTPAGSTYFKPKKTGAMEVTSVGDFFLLLMMKLPMYAVLAFLAWKLSPHGVSLFSEQVAIYAYIILAALFAYEVKQTYKINGHLFKQEVPEIHQYKFKQVAVLNVLYFATFGSELAVISMLPLFFSEVFALDMVYAGLLASLYAFMNLMSRPGGGWLSDKFGRKKTLLILTAGLAIGYFAMSTINSNWPLVLAVLAVMCCSFFVQAGEGAVFAAVPLIKRRLTGQIAGMTGAYGNVGAVVYLTVLSMVDYQTFFLVIAGTSLLGFITLLLMEEPKGSIAEVREDGSVELISVG